MPVPDSFLATCRPLVQALPEYAAYQSARQRYGAAADDVRAALWRTLYSDAQAGGMSLAHQLRRAIRDIVKAQATSSMSGLDCEAAYRTLSGEVVAEEDRPLTDTEEVGALLPAVLSQLLN